jgi:hypothetical protein
MKYKVHVTSATRDDLVLRAVESIRDIGNIHLWVDGRESSPHNDGVEHHSPGRVGIVPMMNMCIKTSWDDDVMFWMHEDAEAAPNVAKQFLDMVTKQINERWGVYFTNGDKFCAFNMRAVRQVGWWDVAFLQYNADIDYYRRMTLGHWQVRHSGLEVRHSEHMTGSEGRLHAGDPDYMRKIQFTDFTQFAHHYYEFKWGGGRGQERFVRPFNEDQALPQYQAIFAKHRAARELQLKTQQARPHFRRGFAR